MDNYFYDPNIKQREVNIKVDRYKGFFKKSELNQDEINYLLSGGYKVSSHVGLNGIKYKYLIKPRYNETTSHFFLIKAIESHIREYTNKIQLYETTKPDIIFEVNNKKIAIEVETGMKFDKDINSLKEKVSILNEKYRKWFFVVTKQKYKKKYEMLGTTYLRTDIPQIMKKLFSGRGKNCEGIQKEA